MDRCHSDERLQKADSEREGINGETENALTGFMN